MEELLTLDDFRTKTEQRIAKNLFALAYKAYMSGNKTDLSKYNQEQLENFATKYNLVNKGLMDFILTNKNIEIKILDERTFIQAFNLNDKRIFGN